MDESQGYIIQRVLEYGQMNDWKLINLYYGLDLIVEECKKLRTLNPVCLAFICTISHTKGEEYRCYYSTGNQGCLECGSYYIDFRVSCYKLAHLR